MGRFDVRGLRRWLALAGLMLLAACASGGGDSGNPDNPGGGGQTPDASAVVTPAGGQVATDDGALALDFPAGALPADTTVTITEVENPTATDVLAAFADGGTVIAFDLGPSPLTFAQPVTVTVALDLADLPGADALTVPLLAVADVGPDGVASPLTDLAVRVDTAAGKLYVSGGITHFSQLQAVVEDKAVVTLEDVPGSSPVGVRFQVHVVAKPSPRLTNTFLSVTATDASTGRLMFDGAGTSVTAGNEDYRNFSIVPLNYHCTDVGAGFLALTVKVAPPEGQEWEFDHIPVAGDYFAREVRLPSDGGVPVTCDPLLVGFGAPSYASSGETGTVEVPVEMTGPVSTDVTVPILIEDNGTATEGLDYTVTPTTVTIPAGSTSANVTVTIHEDQVAEGDEWFGLAMGDPTGAERGLAHTVVTIKDDDGPPPAPPTVAFGSSAQYSLSESGKLKVHVLLSAASPSNAVVDYAVSASSTATKGVDYTIPDGPLVIPAGATEGVIEISITEDTQVEPSETVVIDLISATGADLGTLTTHTATITDDDGVVPRVTDHSMNLSDLLTDPSRVADVLAEALAKPGDMAYRNTNDWSLAQSLSETCPSVTDRVVGDPAEEVFEVTIDWGTGCDTPSGTLSGTESFLWGLSGAPPNGGYLDHDTADRVVDTDPVYGHRDVFQEQGHLDVHSLAADAFVVRWLQAEVYHHSQTGSLGGGSSVSAGVWEGNLTFGLGAGGEVVLNGTTAGDVMNIDPPDAPTGPPDLGLADVLCTDTCPYSDPSGGRLEMTFENLRFSLSGSCSSYQPESGDVVFTGAQVVRYHFGPPLECGQADVTIGDVTTPGVNTGFFLYNTLPDPLTPTP